VKRGDETVADETVEGDAARPKTRFRLTLQYDGAAYHGWQVQPDLPTVQGAIEEVVSRIAGQRHPVLGSGRTDSGVHATGQVASVDLPSKWTALRLRGALNALLPKDIWVAAAAPAPPDFHPRFDALDRTYHYHIALGPDANSPFRRPWCWPIAKDLDTDLLGAASVQLIGDHSFKAFAKTGQPERGDRCSVVHAEWSSRPAGLRWTITANRYLHHMVRYLVGTMVDIGMGKRGLEDLSELLSGSERVRTSNPAPPQGLFLHRVRYPGDPEHPPIPVLTGTLTHPYANAE